MANLAAIKEAIEKGRLREITGLVQAALNDGADPQTLINDYMIEAMKTVGARFENKEIFVPEMMIAGRTMQTGLNLLKPLITAREGQQSSKGVVVMGTVFGDLHDIGKNLVILMLESSGFSVFDLGVNISPDKFVAAAREHKADLVGMSCLLTTGYNQVKATVAALKNGNLSGNPKVICGGAALSEKFTVQECNADGYSSDAAGAVRLCEKLVGVKS